MPSEASLKNPEWTLPAPSLYCPKKPTSTVFATLLLAICNMLSSMLICVVLIAELEPRIVMLPVICMSPPTYMFLAIPAPPSTINAPVVTLVDCVVLATSRIPPT